MSSANASRQSGLRKAKSGLGPSGTVAPGASSLRRRSLSDRALLSRDDDTEGDGKSDFDSDLKKMMARHESQGSDGASTDTCTSKSGNFYDQMILKLKSIDYKKLVTENKDTLIKVSIAIPIMVLIGLGPFMLFILISILVFIRNVIGLAISIGLAIGFASHVYDTLERASLHQSKDENTAVGEAYAARRHNYRNSISSSTANRHLGDGASPGSGTGASSQLSGSGTSVGGSTNDKKYHNLMRRAGYMREVSAPMRGQLVMKRDDKGEKGEGRRSVSKGVILMARLWPDLPPSVNREIGLFMDNIIRDFVCGWYSKIDNAVDYVDPTKKRDKLERSESLPASPKKDRPSGGAIRSKSELTPSARMAKSLVTSTTSRNSSPFIEVLSLSLGHVLGQLSTSAGDNVNVMELILINVVSAIGKSLKVFREMKKRGEKYQFMRWQNGSGDVDLLDIPKPSEMCIAREFMQAQRLHKAVTFGMDVPSLLYGDPKGELSPKPGDEDSVLEQRLFGTNMLYENELDYCRVLAHRLCRKVMRPDEFRNELIRSFVVEVMASCIFMPVLGFFVPETINGWIVMAIDILLGEKTDSAKKEDAAEETKTKENVTKNDLDRTNIPPEKSSVSKSDSVAACNADAGKGVSTVAASTARDTTESAKTIKEQSNSTNIGSTPTNTNATTNLDETSSSGNISKTIDSSVTSSPDNAQHDNSGCTSSTVIGSMDSPSSSPLPGTEISSSSTFSIKEEDEDAEKTLDLINETIEDELLEEENCLVDENNSITSVDDDEVLASLADDGSDVVDDDEKDSSHILPMVTEAVAEVDSFVRTGKKTKEGEPDWDDNETKMAVCQLVLVIEVALKHGRNKKVQEQQQQEKMALSNVLMEMTTDIKAFQEKTTENPSWFIIAAAAKEDEISSLAAIDGEDMTVIDEVAATPTETPAETSMSSFFSDETVTFRTLVATWLQQGDIYKAFKVMLTFDSLLNHFYEPYAFLRSDELVFLFAKQLKALDGIDVLVDTMTVLSQSGLEISQRGDAYEEGEEEATVESSPSAPLVPNNGKMVTTTPTSTHTSPLPPGQPVHAQAQQQQQQQQQQRSKDAALTASQSRPAISSALSVSLLRPWGDGQNQQQAAAAESSSTSSTTTPSQKMSIFNVKANIRSHRQRVQRWVGASHSSITNSALLLTSSQQSPSMAATPSSTSSNRSLDSSSSQEKQQQRVSTPSISSSMTHTPSRQQQQQRRNSFASSTSSHHSTSATTAAHLLFHKNESFASSLRAERERRMESWRKATIAAATTGDGNYRMLDIVHSRRSRVIHRELHTLARTFYTTTVGIGVECGEDNNESDRGGCDLVLDAVSARRMIEVPDDDSSFLLRAQPRAIEPIGSHKDDRNHDASHKIYASCYEDHLNSPKTNRYAGGRYIRHCLLKYFPSNRTAIVTPVRDFRNMRRGGPMNKTPSSLPETLSRDRHLCCKPNARSATAGVLMSNLVEPGDFNATPRTGKAIDFVYRMTLFERPMVEVAARKFIITDGNKVAVHRADASALELSDASLSIALLLSGEFAARKESSDDSVNEDDGPDSKANDSQDEKENNETSENNVDTEQPLMVRIKVSSKNDDSPPEYKSYRPSYIRAALLVASARQEAQHQCLIWSVRRGSARKATRSRTEALLQPTLNVIDFATSQKREKESILLRDLKLGMNNIDKEQLRRNGVLHPRHPTFLRGLNAKVESVVQGSGGNRGGHVVGGGDTSISYKIRCVALAELTTPHGRRKVYRVEWAVLRPFRDFLTLHKHLKTQVSPIESSSGHPRFAAATAAILAPGAAMSGSTDTRRRKGLVPSLSAATKAGALALTKKGLDKRRIVLNEYIMHLLSRGHLLKRSPEILRFLGADEPLDCEVALFHTSPEEDGSSGAAEGEPQLVRVSGAGVTQDSLGRFEAQILQLNPDHFPEIGALRKPGSSPTKVTVTQKPKEQKQKQQQAKSTANNQQNKQPNSSSLTNQTTTPSRRNSSSPSTPSPTTTSRQIPLSNSKTTNTPSSSNRKQQASIKSRIERVQLSQVRDVVFEFIRHQFNLDNATFFRSRLVSAIRTMSFVAVSSNDFNNMLFQAHLKYINGESIGGMIKWVRDILWPEGVWFTSAPPLTTQEKQNLETESKAKLMAIVPEQLKRLLGQEITQEGLDLLHEMLQNRLVLKSLGYIVIDMLWQDVFPDLGDVLTGMDSLNFEE